jgi:hypothetical protein
MADIVPADHEDDLLGHVGRVVGNALEMFRDPNHADACLDLHRPLRHVTRHHGKDGRVALVDRIVAAEDKGSARVVPLNEGIESPMQHVERSSRHRSEAIVDEVLRGAVALDGPLADVDRLVADAFQIGDESERRCKKRSR